MNLFTSTEFLGERGSGLLPGRYRPRVLLAEDDPDLRHLLADALAEDGYEVVELGSGLQLFDELRARKLRDDPPAMVVSDVWMPGLSGLEVLRAMRAWGWTLPMLLITAFGDDELLSAAYGLDATAVFSKPFDVDDLRTAVMHFLPLAGQARRGRTSNV